MNSLDDLRSTLESHSHDAAGLDPVARSSQLKGRIAAARRRRNAVRSGLTVAVVAAVVSVATLPGLRDGGQTPEPAASVAERTTLGEVAPATMAALGRPYEFVSHSTNATGTSVTLEPDFSEEPPLLSWTTRDPAATVTVTDDSEKVLWSSQAGSFSDHVVLDQWNGGRVTVTSTAPGVAAALYAFDTDGEIAGVSEGGVTFPQKEDGRGLLTGGFGGRGTVRMRMPFDVSTGRISLAVHCSGAEDAAVHATIEGETISHGECDSPASGIERSTTTFTLGPGQRADELEVELVRSVTDTRPVDREYPDVLLGAAIYEPRESSEFEGISTESTTEHSGHLWTIETDKNSKPAARLTVDLDTTEPHLVAGVQSGTRGDADDVLGGIGLEVDGDEVNLPGGVTSPDGVSTTPLLVAPGAEKVAVTPGTDPAVTGTQLVVWRLLS